MYPMYLCLGAHNLLSAGLHGYALTDSVLHFNDGKMGHAGIFRRMISLLTFIIGLTTPAGYNNNTIYFRQWSIWIIEKNKNIHIIKYRLKKVKTSDQH